MDRSESISFPPTPIRLLDRLPAEAIDHLCPLLETVELRLHQVLHHAGDAIDAVYFPTRGWISMLAYMSDGDAVEVGMIGREGMVGLPLLLGANHDDLEALVQAPTTALRLEAVAFHDALEWVPGFRTLLLRYALVHHGQVARTAACNGRHSIQQRLARWLLIAHDRSDEDRFPMTHEFLSMMLGVRRAGVSVAAASFQKLDLIRYDRGRVEITDRAGLENVACECYAIARQGSEALLGVSVAPHH